MVKDILLTQSPLPTDMKNNKRAVQVEPTSPRRVTPKTTTASSPTTDDASTEQSKDPSLSGEEQSSNELIFPTLVAGFDLSDVPPLEQIPGLNVTGVLPYKNKWRATCVIDGKSVVLGDYDDSKVAAWVHHAVLTKQDQPKEARGFVEEHQKEDWTTEPQQEENPVFEVTSPPIKEEVVDDLDIKDEEKSKSLYKGEVAPSYGDKGDEDYSETLVPESQEERTKAWKRKQAQQRNKIQSPVQRILDHCKALEMQTGSPDIRRSTIAALCGCQQKTFMKTIMAMKMRQCLITYDKHFIRLTDKGRKRANGKNASVLDDASLQAHLKKRHKLHDTSALLFDLLCDGQVHNRAAASVQIGITEKGALASILSSMKRKHILDYNTSTVWLTDMCFFGRPGENDCEPNTTTHCIEIVE